MKKVINPATNKNWTEAEIMKHFLIEPPKQTQKQNNKDHTAIKSTIPKSIAPSPNDSAHSSDEGPITLSMIEQYIKAGLHGQDVDPALVSQAFKLLEMKEKHADNSSVIEAEQLKLDEVRASVFNKLRSAPCDQSTNP